MSERPDPISPYISQAEAPEGALPLVRITISLLPDGIPGRDDQPGMSLGLEVGHPVDPRLINASQTFGMLHSLLPVLERKVRAEWVEHRKVCRPGEPE